MKNLFLNILQNILKRLARLTIRRFEPDVIAITGSVGKTSAKEVIFAVLKDCFKTRKSEGNFNNEIGVALTILGDWQKIERPLFFFWLKVICVGIFQLVFLPKRLYPKILILEYGADKPGDIKYLLEIAKPKIAVVTAVGDTPTHIEHYSDSSAVAREKSRLVEHLSSSGFAILNLDDDIVEAMKEKTRGKTIFFGFNELADIKISNFENKSEDGKPFGIFFKVERPGSFVPVALKGIFGQAHAYAAAVGVAVGLIYEMNLIEIAESILLNYKPAKHRMNLLSGLKNCYIIDDSYNASPAAMKLALETLRQLDGNKKIAVLGDMLELGEYAMEAHEKIGKQAAEFVDILITVGPRGKLIAASAEANGLAKEKILSFDVDEVEQATAAVSKIAKKGDLVLVKASRAIGLDKLVDALVV